MSSNYQAVLAAVRGWVQDQDQQFDTCGGLSDDGV